MYEGVLFDTSKWAFFRKFKTPIKIEQLANNNALIKILRNCTTQVMRLRKIKYKKLMTVETPVENVRGSRNRKRIAPIWIIIIQILVSFQGIIWIQFYRKYILMWQALLLLAKVIKLEAKSLRFNALFHKWLEHLMQPSLVVYKRFLLLRAIFFLASVENLQQFLLISSIFINKVWILKLKWPTNFNK